MGSNRILPLIAGLILLMVLFIGIKSCTTDNQDAAQLSAVPVPGTPDADSPADTIRTLTAEVAAIKNESKKLSQQNEQLLRQREAIESRVKAQLRNEMQQAVVDNETSMVGGLTQQLEFFKARLDELSTAQNQSVGLGMGDIPVGFGLDGQDRLPASTPDIIWVEPLGAQTDAQGQPVTISCPF